MSLHPLNRAAQLGDLEALRRELAAGADPDSRHSEYPDNPDIPGWTALAWLCVGKQPTSQLITNRCITMSDDVRLQCIRALLDAGASPNANNDDRAPLTYATAQGYAAIVRVLLAAGADPRFADSGTHGTLGWTALHAAAGTGSVSCAIALIKAGADVDAEITSPYNMVSPTPLLYVIRHNGRRKQCMIWALLRGGARLDMTRMAALPGGAPPYITKVDAAGGWKKYEQSHRKRLTTMFTRVLFPHLPIGAISNIVYFWAHVGFY